MKVFYLYSDWKWTGPAEPAVNVFRALVKRGIAGSFFCGPSPVESTPLRDEAAKRDVTVREDLFLPKHLHWYYTVRDVMKLRKMLLDEKPDIVHCNRLNDHLIANMAREKNSPVKIIRSTYSGDGEKRYLRNIINFKSGTDGVTVISRHSYEIVTENFPHLKDRIREVEVGVDLERFNPDRPLPDLRERMGFTDDHLVLGIVARMQFRRKFDILLGAVDRLVKKHPHLRVAIVGRGTHQEDVVMKPSREMNLTEFIHFPGYLSGDDYPGVLKMFDIKLLMVPGSDGSCRAVRQAMAMNNPIVVGNTGVLPELVEKSQGGLVFDYTVDSLTEKLDQMITDEEMRRDMAKKARKFAVEQMSLDHQAEQIEQLYREVLEG